MEDKSFIQNKLRIVAICNYIEPGSRESYWIETLETSYPKGLNYK